VERTVMLVWSGVAAVLVLEGGGNVCGPPKACKNAGP